MIDKDTKIIPIIMLTVKGSVVDHFKSVNDHTVIIPAMQSLRKLRI